MHIDKYEHRGEKFSHMSFDSLTDAMNFYTDCRDGKYIINHSYNKGKVQEYTSGERHSLDWTGYRTNEEYLKVMREGDLEKAKEIWDIPSPEIVVESIRRRVRWGETGDSLSLERYLDNDFDRMWRSTYKRKAVGGTKNITLTADIAGNCGVTSTELGWRGMSTLKIADVLSGAGYNVRILCYDFAIGDCQGIDHNSFVTTPLKDFDEGLDVTKLASLICRSAYFRTVGFTAIVAMADNQDVDVCSGLGRSAHFQEGDWKSDFIKEKCFEGEGGGQMYNIPVVKNKEGAMKAISDVLKHFNIEEA